MRCLVIWIRYHLERSVSKKGSNRAEGTAVIYPPLRLFSIFLNFSFSHWILMWLIKRGAQPPAVRSRLMESTWLTDKPAENKLSGSCRPLINPAWHVWHCLDPSSHHIRRRFYLQCADVMFQLFLFINACFLFSVTMNRGRLFSGSDFFTLVIKLHLPVPILRKNRSGNMSYEIFP